MLQLKSDSWIIRMKAKFHDWYWSRTTLDAVSPTTNLCYTTKGGVTLVDISVLLAQPDVREAIKTLSDKAAAVAKESCLTSDDNKK